MPLRARRQSYAALHHLAPRRQSKVFRPPDLRLSSKQPRLPDPHRSSRPLHYLPRPLSFICLPLPTLHLLPRRNLHRYGAPRPRPAVDSLHLSLAQPLCSARPRNKHRYPSSGRIPNLRSERPAQPQSTFWEEPKASAQHPSLEKRSGLRLPSAQQLRLNPRSLEDGAHQPRTSRVHQVKRRCTHPLPSSVGHHQVKKRQHRSLLAHSTLPPNSPPDGASIGSCPR